ncbi:MAG: AAA family ATPase [Balneolaceae bacterium]|nr:AAA family ATPase [Balneolaceae bacterium]
MVDDTWTFEVDGPSKTREQIHGVPNAFIAADGLEEASGDKIPLWLFGFLY